MKRILGVALLLGASIVVSNAIYGQNDHRAPRDHRDFRVVVDRDGLGLEFAALQEVLEDLEVELADISVELSDLEGLSELRELEGLEALEDLDSDLAERIEARLEERIRLIEARTEEVARNGAAHEGSRNAGPQDSETFTWSGRIDQGGTVLIRGVNGPVFAEAWDGAEVVVEAVKSGRKADPSTVRIEVVEHAGGVTVCAVYPGAGNDCQADGRGKTKVKDNDVRVEFRVRVPEGVDFVGRTVNGDVEALRIDGNAEGYTVNGNIDLDATGSAEAATVNGSITLELPADVNADLDAQWLSGGIESDLPIELEGKFWQRSASARFGSGGPDLDIATVNGSIRLIARK